MEKKVGLDNLRREEQRIEDCSNEVERLTEDEIDNLVKSPELLRERFPFFPNPHSLVNVDSDHIESISSTHGRYKNESRYE